MSLIPGAPAPLFSAPSPANPAFSFGSLGGRYLVLAFLPGPGPERRAALQLVAQHRAMFDDEAILFFGVLPDEASFAEARNIFPYRWFGDLSGELRRLYRAVDEAGELQPQWVVVDPMLRVLRTAPLSEAAAVLAWAAGLGDPDAHAGAELHAPVLIVPRIFEPDVCRHLIELYRNGTPGRSGVMRERGGKTVGVLDDFKSRRDLVIRDEPLQAALRQRIIERLLPQVAKVFQFHATRMERYIVACYDAAEGGHFAPHRDNTTSGTAHRRFAVSINLNAEAYEGGDLRFREFGRRTYRPPTGGAVVFSCSLLHEATAVTRGARYAFLPFLYDEEAARIRERNQHTLAAAETPPEDASTPGPG
jgi:hypothetical protein